MSAPHSRPTTDPGATGPQFSIVGAMPATAWPSLPDDVGAQLLAMQFQFDRSQWWSAQALHTAQDRQLDVLLPHAGKDVPYYRDRWKAAGIDPDRISANDFHALPVIERLELNEHVAKFESRNCPPQHGKVYQDTTSGSMGVPLKFKATDLHSFFWHAFVMRDHLWHGRDLGAKMAIIRHGVSEVSVQGWGGMLDRVVASGTCASLPIMTDVERQLEWLTEQAPAYLLSYPSNLRALLVLARKKGVPLPSLREIRTFGEYVTDDLPSMARAIWNVPLTDVYSSQECGYIALQCPAASGYHVMSENLRVEVLDTQGQPCAPGETGRVVVTTLHNFAMPLIRYAIGDFAEVGAACECGRGLPRLTRIMGRQRNLIRTPDGRRIWPVVGIYAWIDKVAVSQLRLVQRRTDALEMHYVRDRDLDPEETRIITEHVQKSLGWPFTLDWRRCEFIPAGPTGKFEDVICTLPENDQA
jgi:phenylacetate-CoA ligase